MSTTAILAHNRAASPKILLSLSRILSLIYFSGIIMSQINHPHYYLALPLTLASSLFSLLVLQHFKYDMRSSAVLLLIFCQLYFFARIDFIVQPWGWYYILCHVAFLVFIIGLFAGIKLFGGRVRGNHLKASIQSVMQPTSRTNRLYLVGVGTLTAYAMGLNHLLSSTSASGSFIELVFQSINTRLAIAENGLSPLLQLMYVLSSFGLGCGYILWKTYKHRALIFVWIFLLGYSALVLGSRGAIVIPIVQLFLASSLLMKRPLVMLGIITLPLIIAINIFSTWYLAAREGLDAISDESYSIINRFDAYENWIGFSAAEGLKISPGASIPAVFFQFVPRSIYQEKPYYFSTEMTRVYVPDAFNRGINLDFGGIAESIYNFGPIGPPLFGLFLGWIACRLDRYKERACQFKDPLSAYIFAQGALIPASFFFVGWINTPMIFVIIGFILTVKIFKFIEGNRGHYGSGHRN
jgi:oligosaccharide repeat unit polymerase